MATTHEDIPLFFHDCKTELKFDLDNNNTTCMRHKAADNMSHCQVEQASMMRMMLVI